jgi:hypothetical protein
MATVAIMDTLGLGVQEIPAAPRIALDQVRALEIPGELDQDWSREPKRSSDIFGSRYRFTARRIEVSHQTKKSLPSGR